MTPSLEETIYLDFITSASTGAAADADSTPTFEVFEDANDTALTLSGSAIAKRASKTGNYRITLPVTAANGFEAGKSYNVVASATVGGVAAKAVVARFQARARDTDDLLSTLGANAPANWINAAAISTDAITAAKLAADAVTEIQSGLATAAALATVAGYLDTEIAAVLATTAKLDSAMELDGSVYRFTTNALEQAPTGGGGGGGTDWTADERTAIRAILGIPASGTTPATPTTGALGTLLTRVPATLTFTSDALRVDVRRINGTVVSGAGVSGNPWGP